MACQQTVEGVGIPIHDFGVAAVGDQKHVIRLLTFGVLDIDDFVIVAHYHQLKL